MKSFFIFFFFSIQLIAQKALVEKVKQLRPDTPWELVRSTPLSFPTFHPQGMVKIGDVFYMSSVEVTRKRQDNDGGEGKGHLFKFDTNGKLLAQITLGEGAIYHPGGIDFDGKFIWVPVAEYRPKSQAIIYKVNPQSLKVEEVMQFGDHIGGIVHDTQAHALTGISWGSRTFYTWPLNAKQKPIIKLAASQKGLPNPSFYVDYQDCHYVGQHQMLCGGLRKYRTSSESPVYAMGGLELVNLIDKRPVFQIPLPLWSPTGAPMTNNPFWVETTSNGIRAYFVPDDDAASTLFVYETR